LIYKTVLTTELTDLGVMSLSIGEERLDKVFAGAQDVGLVCLDWLAKRGPIGDVEVSLEDLTRERFTDKEIFLFSPREGVELGLVGLRRLDLKVFVEVTPVAQRRLDPRGTSDEFLNETGDGILFY
jgi:hypothetical protein